MGNVLWGDLQEYIFLEPPGWDFGAEIDAEVPETPKHSVAHWGPLTWCLEKDPGQSGQPVHGTVGAN